MPAIGPELPPHLRNRASNDDSDDGEEQHGPQSGPQIGPQIPVGAGPPAHVSTASTSTARTLGTNLRTNDGDDIKDEDEDDDDIGPQPLPAGLQPRAEDGVREFLDLEERRRKRAEEALKPKKLQRDEWMLAPPTSSDLLASLDPTKLKARQFSRSTAPVKSKSKADSSLWTETPTERQQRLADEVAGKKKRAANAEEDALDEEEREAVRKRMRRDEEIRKGVDEHTKKVRGSTLVDQHSSKSKASNANSEKETDAIWDHSRDMGLGGRLMDDKTRDKMLTDAKGLGSRFGTGQSGGFL